MVDRGVASAETRDILYRATLSHVLGVDSVAVGSGNHLAKMLYRHDLETHKGFSV